MGLIPLTPEEIQARHVKARDCIREANEICKRGKQPIECDIIDI